MNKSIYWWISLVVAAVFGAFIGIYIKEWPQFMFSVFLLMSYGVCCSLDAIRIIKPNTLLRRTQPKQ